MREATLHLATFRGAAMAPWTLVAAIDLASLLATIGRGDASARNDEVIMIETNPCPTRRPGPNRRSLLRAGVAMPVCGAPADWWFAEVAHAAALRRSATR